MSRFEHVTKYIPQLEVESDSHAGNVLYGQFETACYAPDITDHDYIKTLEERGITGDKLWHANVESLDMRSTLALLTFILRADHMCEGALQQALEGGYLLRVLRRLAELDGTWVRPNVVTFYHEYEKDGYLSNWYDSGFSFAGNTFPTSEHWMMWQKACVFGSGDAAEQILALPASEQGKVKWLGKNKVPSYDDDVWEAVDLQLMRVGLRQKFAQNERLLNDLLGTGSAVLGEAAGTKDAKWGVGFDKHSPKLADPANWYGESLLGRTLMEVRSELRQLCNLDGCFEWPIETLRQSQVWRMNLLELARVPSTRSFALMYATIVAQHCSDIFKDDRDVLRKVRANIGEIDEAMRLNMGGGLPIAGWHELVDELAFQVRVGMV